MYVPVGILGWWMWVHVMTLPPPEVTVKYNASVCLILASVGLEVATDVPYILAELQLWSKTKVLYCPVYLSMYSTDVPVGTLISTSLPADTMPPNIWYIIKIQTIFLQ